MQFKGRIKKVLEARSGVSQRTGNEWKALPFVFEYFEHETDRYADSVVLETFDTNVINNLKEGQEVVCGFSHRTREYEGKFYNELRLYKIESVAHAQRASQQPAGPSAQEAAQQAQHAAPSTATSQQPNQDDDDLPF